MAQTAHTRQYRGTRYWEREEPRTATTDKFLVSYYPMAGKFQVSAVWKDRDSGAVKRGRTAVLDAGELASNPDALTLLAQFLKAARAMKAKVQPRVA